MKYLSTVIMFVIVIKNRHYCIWDKLISSREGKKEKKNEVQVLGRKHNKPAVHQTMNV